MESRVKRLFLLYFYENVIQYKHTIKGGFVIWQEKTGMLKYTRKN